MKNPFIVSEPEPDLDQLKRDYSSLRRIHRSILEGDAKVRHHGKLKKLEAWFEEKSIGTVNNDGELIQVSGIGKEHILIGE